MRAVPAARVIWRADFDPGTLQMSAQPRPADCASFFDPERFRSCFVLVTDSMGCEHALLSDGYHHIRIDIEKGSLAGQQPVELNYALSGVLDASAEAQLLPLRRLAGLCRTGRFLPSLFPRDRRAERLIEVLRVHDALSAGASQREIALHLFGRERVPNDWREVSDSLRSRVRRMVREARRMAGGGYRLLLGRKEGD